MLCETSAIFLELHQFHLISRAISSTGWITDWLSMLKREGPDHRAQCCLLRGCFFVWRDHAEPLVNW